MKAEIAGTMYFLENDKKCGDCKKYDECYAKSSMLFPAQDLDDYEQSKFIPACVSFEEKGHEEG